ncbi:MAG TPA: DNA-processing protein DprA [Stenotrophobium sp.]|nr:DNA-processing protein DprA [Stenotrophobium sp.]
MRAEALKSWLILIRAEGVGPVSVARLLAHFPDAEAALQAGRSGWRKAGLDGKAQAGLSAPDLSRVESDLDWLSGPRRTLVTIDDPRYPPLLRECDGAPPALFCQGDPDLLPLPQLAMVGARSATPQGIENAQAFAADLAGRGLVITSGLAMGIDGAAHRGALSVDGLTLAVCGTGLDRVYPAQHREMAHQIAQKGLLVSEFPPGTPGRPENFPRRNRIISGLSLGVLVVEAARESGSLITARMASEQGREVFAIPGSIHNPLARGCHGLIRQGAKLVESANDILEEIAPHIRIAQRPSASATAAAAIDPQHQDILDALGDDSLSVDQLVQRTGMPVAALSAALLALELEGHAAVVDGGQYQRLRRRQ